MKKQLLTLAATIVAVSAMAQGTVNLANSSGTLITRITTGSSTANVASADFGRLQFAWAASGTAVTPWNGATSLTGWLAANPGVTLVDKVINIGVPVAGRFSGGAVTIGAVNPAGAEIQGFMIGWSGGASAFGSFDAAFASSDATVRAMITPAFTVNTGNPNATPSPDPSASLYAPDGTFTGMTLAPITIVPEPASFALIGLGAAALLVLRRRP